MTSWDAVMLDRTDHVATALRQLVAGENARVRSAGDIKLIVVSENIPLCHKIAVQDIPHGGIVKKYGESIGAATADIRTGQHVHIHNLKSLRASKL